jgi:TfoX/Sxy family transcriptional regulator of competence genes
MIEPAMKGGTNPQREALAERIRQALENQPALKARPMFGVLAFLVDDSMVVAARKDGSLLVRVDPARGEAFLSMPGTKIAEMGAGRSMGPSWLAIEREALDDDTLAFWIGAALDFNGRGS